MRYLLGVTALAFIMSISSCKEGMNFESVRNVIQDSMITVLPTWQALKLKPEDDGTKMLIVVGDASFYKASADVKAAKAKEVGKLILRICGSNNYLDKGTLIVTANTKNDAEAPADGISLAIDFAALKKEMGQK